MDVLKKREYYLDILKILACFLVIVNHTNSVIFLNGKPSLVWFLSLTYFFISKMAVPLFIMISGAVLLGKEETYKAFFLKRVLKMILVLIVFSFLMHVLICKDLSFDGISNFLINLFKGPIITSYWYLYMLIGLYAMTPLLRKMIKQFNNADFLYFMIICILYNGFLPFIVLYLNWNVTSYLYLPLFGGYVSLYIMGYYFSQLKLSEKAEKKLKYFCWLGLIIPIIIAVVLTFQKYTSLGKISLFLDNVNYFTTTIPSISVFLLIRYFYKNKKLNEKLSKVLVIVSSTTLGVYLIHSYMITKLYNVFTWLSGEINVLIAMIIFEIFIFIICGFIIFILRQIPAMKKLI